jgi:hypothetical protein
MRRTATRRAGQTGGRLNANGTWTGVMGELVNGRADISLYPVILTEERAQAVQYTSPYMAMGLSMLVRQEQSDAVNGGTAFLLPFQVRGWGWECPRCGGLP